MKAFNYSLLGLGTLLFFACNSPKKQSEIPVFDVSKNYPKKEIILQDIADVEYIPLETSDSVLLSQYSTAVPISKDKFLTFDLRKGDVFLFGTDGKLITQFNHKGQSGKEYKYIMQIIPDKEKQELYLFDGSSHHQIQVYDMSGEYKRTVKYDKGLKVSDFNAFGESEVICYQSNLVFFEPKDDTEKNKKPQLVVLSKDSGATDTIIELPTTEGVDAVSRFEKDGRKGFFIRKPAFFIKYKQGFIVNEIACDTVFLLQEDKSLTPLLARTPKVSSTDNPQKMVAIKKITRDAYYLEVMLKKFEIGGKNNFPTTHYVWNKKENKFYEYTLRNADVETPKDLVTLRPLSLLSADNLKELLEEGKLSGKLKEIAENLNEDDNPVLVKVKFKE